MFRTSRFPGEIGEPALERSSMNPTSRRLPPVLLAAGQIGLALLFIGPRLGWTFLPTDDFDVGIWVGGCIGLDIVALMLILKAKFEPAS